MFTDINERNCWEAGEERLTPLDVFNPSKSEMEDAQEEYQDARRDIVEDIALKWFQPEVVQNWDVDEWEEFEERIGIY